MTHVLKAGMVGMGMIFEETYRPFFENTSHAGIFDRRFGDVGVPLAAVATRTGRRAEAFRQQALPELNQFHSAVGENAVADLVTHDVDFVCIATPDDRHFEAAKVALSAGKHVLIEKPSVLALDELDELCQLARQQNVLAKVVYHKLLDPDHKKLRTLVADGQLQHVNHGYCSLFEPRQISQSQFAEWITGRNPATYVAVHYIKLIDFTFGGRLKRISAEGQRGLVAAADSATWDSVQLRLVYEYDSGREAAFDIQTSWVHPDNFPGYVEQEVQFRFDNGVWNGHSRRRGVECVIDGTSLKDHKQSLNNHYNAELLEPWGDPRRQGCGLEVIERFVREVAFVEFAESADRHARLNRMRQLSYNDLTADRQVVAAVQGLEAILKRQANGHPGGCVFVNESAGGLVLRLPGISGGEVLYPGTV